MHLDEDEYLLVLNEAGAVVGYTKNPDEAWHMAESAGLHPFWLAPPMEEGLRKANPPRGRQLPKVDDPGHLDYSNRADYQAAIAARKRTAMPYISFDEVKRISQEDAYELIRPIFEEASEACKRDILRRRGSAVGIATDLDAWKGLSKGWLGENAKLHKPDKRSNLKTMALGLSLLPEASIFRGRPEAWVLSNEQLLIPDPAIRIADGHAVDSPLNDRPYHTLCPNSSAQCRATCLVFVGQNQSDFKNNYAKWARTKALLTQPVAFMRLLTQMLLSYENTKSKASGRGTALKFARLNVFSDIPWEVVTPWLFELFPHQRRQISKKYSYLKGDLRTVNFYDYTKIAGRPFVPNYHLTYSYSGTKASLQEADNELARGRNVAMVFAAQGYLRHQSSGFVKAATKGMSKKSSRYTAGFNKGQEKYRKMSPLPTHVVDPRINGGQPVKVIDADASDIRPLDPSGCIVGLRWKPPTLKKGDQGRASKGIFREAPFGFVTPGRVIETPQGMVFVLPETPLMTAASHNVERATDGFVRQMLYEKEYKLPAGIEVFPKKGAILP